MTISAPQKKTRRWTRGERQAILWLSVATVVLPSLHWVASIWQWHDASTFFFYVSVPLPAAWIVLPMWLAGRHDGWGPLRGELNTKREELVPQRKEKSASHR